MLFFHLPSTAALPPPPCHRRLATDALPRLAPLSLPSPLEKRLCRPLPSEHLKPVDRPCKKTDFMMYFTTLLKSWDGTTHVLQHFWQGGYIIPCILQHFWHGGALTSCILQHFWHANSEYRVCSQHFWPLFGFSFFLHTFYQTFRPGSDFLHHFARLFTAFLTFRHPFSCILTWFWLYLHDI